MEHLAANKALWNARVDVHAASAFYDVAGWKAGATSLKKIELDLLGEVRGERLLHLQCHFGQDTLSLARMGAEVTGLDLSDKAIAKARELATEMGLAATFVESDVLAMTEAVTGPFDTIFTSYGVTGWLPTLDGWGQQIAALLKPGGRFVIVEFHPFIWMYDGPMDMIAYSYFNVAPIIEIAEGTYTDGGEDLKNEAYYWNHSLSDVFQALRGAGLEVTQISEDNYTPYKLADNQVPVPNGYAPAGKEGLLPLVYAMEARAGKREKSILLPS